MTLDGLTLRCVINELKYLIVDAKVQKVLMPTKEEVVLQLYSAIHGTAKLQISADAGDCSIYTINATKQNPKTPPSFCMFLRKHLTGAIITDIFQSGLNRVVTLTFAAKDEVMRPVKLQLIVEIMGKYSNIILTNAEGKILDSIKRVSADLSSMRVVLSGMPYAEPPQKKFDPLALSLGTLEETLLTKKETRIVNHITSTFDGISTQTAQEILHRANVDATFTTELSPKLAARVAVVMQEFLQNAIESPHPCVQFNGDGLPVFFSCVPYETYPAETRKTLETCNQMLDYYYTRRMEIFRLTQQREALAKSIGKLLQKVERRIHIYQTSLSDAQKAGKVQKRADLITANLYQLKKGMEDFQTMDYETGTEVTVPLDLSMTPQELAQKLYKKIAKYKKAAEMNNKKLEDALEEQDFLLGALLYTEQAQTGEDITDIRQSLAKAGFLATPSKGKKQEAETESQPLHFLSPSGMDVYVGKNDRQNDMLTMRVAGREDIWFHAQKIPGAHVLLITNGKSLENIDDETVVFAAQLAAAHSRAKQSGKTPVDYTQRRNIKKPPGARPGKVIYDDYFTVYVDVNK